MKKLLVFLLTTLLMVSACAAADTAGYGLISYPEYLGMYSKFLKHGRGVLQRGVGAAVLVGTSVYQ